MKTKTQLAKECPKGKTYGISPRKCHSFIDVSRTKLLSGDPRGDYHVVTRCKLCGEVEEYDCIYTTNKFA